VYEKAILVELKRQGLQANAQQAIKVEYKGILVGEYWADIIVEDKVICEIKAIQSLNIAQLSEGHRR
jgi:GxxExxY protein